MIDGVIITPLKKIPDERGLIMHMMRNDDPNFKQFGEIYFSVAYPGVVKAWHLHSEMTLNYAVPMGMIKLVLFDDREGSKTRGELMEIFTGEHAYQRITVPHGVWNGFKAIGERSALVANCATHPHEKAEISYMDPLKNDLISYNWDLVLK